jgi:hypothetical protein
MPLLVAAFVLWLTTPVFARTGARRATAHVTGDREFVVAFSGEHDAPVGLDGYGIGAGSRAAEYDAVGAKRAVEPIVRESGQKPFSDRAGTGRKGVGSRNDYIAASIEGDRARLEVRRDALPPPNGDSAGAKRGIGMAGLPVARYLSVATCSGPAFDV